MVALCFCDEAVMKNLISLLIFVLLATSQVFFSGAWASTYLEHTDTLVHTLDEQGQAALKPIASLKVGDKVLAKSEWKAEGESLSYEPITDVMVTPMQPRRVVDIWLEDGTHLTATEGHPFKTPEGWRDAILLKRGGQLLLKGEGDSEKTVEIASVTHRTETQTTYNLEVANAHTFFVGEDGVWVHNGKVIIARPGSLDRRKDRREGNQSIVDDRCICDLVTTALGSDPRPHMQSGQSGLKNPPGCQWHHPADAPDEVWLMTDGDHRDEHCRTGRRGGISVGGGK
jgi:hypothetical protein